MVWFCLFLECFLFNRGDPPTFFSFSNKCLFFVYVMVGRKKLCGMKIVYFLFCLGWAIRKIRTASIRHVPMVIRAVAVGW